MVVGSHMLRHWSKTQAGVALSSGEAELYALVKASTAVLGLQSLLGELGHKLECKAVTDSSAARGAVLKAGHGRMKHVHLNVLWIQEKAQNREIFFEKVVRDKNVADLLTHHWTAAEGAKHLDGLRVYRPTAERKGDNMHVFIGSLTEQLNDCVNGTLRMNMHKTMTRTDAFSKEYDYLNFTCYDKKDHSVDQLLRYAGTSLITVPAKVPGGVIVNGGHPVTEEAAHKNRNEAAERTWIHRERPRHANRHQRERGADCIRRDDNDLKVHAAMRSVCCHCRRQYHCELHRGRPRAGTRCMCSAADNLACDQSK